LVEFKESNIDPDIATAELVNDCLKNIHVEIMTEEQFYSALKNELLKKSGVARVVIIRGLYAPNAETASKNAHGIFELTYGGDLPRGCVVFPSFYQIIDPVPTEYGDTMVILPLLLILVGGLGLAGMAKIFT